LSKLSKINLKIVNKNIKIDRLFDILVVENFLYISYSHKVGNCVSYFVSFTEITNFEKFSFKELFTVKDCNDSGTFGKLKSYNHNGSKGILLTVSAGKYNRPSMDAQNPNSFFGKTIFIEIDKKNNYIFSSGHRVIQGLYTENNFIIATEHGPRSGDEINKIIFKKNYGWPISSYGEKYDFDYEENYYYKKNHEENGYEEPIYYFTPSIGISEIKKLGNNFSNFLQDKFLISSLNGRSIYFVSFDNKFSRVMTLEKIFINERVRDLEYETNSKNIFLALEENGELGILSAN
jgi:glucose/arabinose dehydrogenase